MLSIHHLQTSPVLDNYIELFQDGPAKSDAVEIFVHVKADKKALNKPIDLHRTVSILFVVLELSRWLNIWHYGAGKESEQL